jgi:thiol:disulfide interchange protein DsbD
VFLIVVLFGGYKVSAQVLQPVKWSFAAEQEKDNIVVLKITATVDKNWHLYSQYNTESITQATVFTFEKSKNYKLIGKTSEPKYVEFTDDFGTDRYFEKSPVVFKQKIEVFTETPFSIEGEIEAQACMEGKCIMVGTDFSIEIKGIKLDKTISTEQQNTDIDEVGETNDTSKVQQDTTESQSKIIELDNSKNEKENSAWLIFLISFLAGLAALITPCVFPMIPMTISFFMKGDRSRKQGLKYAYFFGISIIFIFAVLGLLLTALLGKDAMYIISTHWIPNFLFFVIFMVFAFSFFGMFEIALPSSWINKSDKQSDKGGYIGAFFIALTTVLVSFSCTGPILGAALIGATSGASNSIVFFISMLGFALGFALPFTLLAMFPEVLKKMKSGSWLNTVKVVFGFLEVALGLKFLSIADLASNWKLLDREIYLALWIVTFTLLGFYLLGKLKFKGDSDLKQISVPRLFLAIASFSFVVYMIPGLWGAPLKGIAGQLPPATTQDFSIEKLIVENTQTNANNLPHNRKYINQLEFPTGFDGFFDLDEAKAFAKKVNKPIFIDFTGKSCSNCRKMEYYVWSDKEVKKILNEDFIMVALYADANFIKLPENEWVKTKDGEIIKTLGRKNSRFQIENFNKNTQPLYVLMDADGNMLTEKTIAYNRNIENFIQFLQEGLEKKVIPRVIPDCLERLFWT